MRTKQRSRQHGPITDPAHQLLSRAAHWHADRGFAVFPLVPGRKVPAVEGWENEATTDHLEIARIWREAPYNIGVATGRSNLLVVDLDQPKTPTDAPPEPWVSRGAASGADVLALVAADNHATVPVTYTVTTPTQGRHLYYRQPEQAQLGNSAGRIGWHIDTRGRGGYIIGAGSTTPAGQYLVSHNHPPQPLPAWITTILTRTPAPPTGGQAGHQRLRDAGSYALAALSGELEKVLAATEGQRNDVLNAAAFALGQLVGGRLLDESIARDELLSAAGRIGLGRSEAERTISSGLTAGTRQPRHHRTR